jgi:hypothetical protein
VGALDGICARHRVLLVQVHLEQLLLQEVHTVRERTHLLTELTGIRHETLKNRLTDLGVLVAKVLSIYSQPCNKGSPTSMSTGTISGR